jgi:hypothetical protein
VVRTEISSKDEFLFSIKFEGKLHIGHRERAQHTTLSSFLTRVSGGEETTMSAGEGPCSGQPYAPGIKEENRNAKRCRNWIRARAGEMAAKRETMMSAGEGPSGGGANLMPETRVLDWILSDSDERPNCGKEERAGEGCSEVGEAPASHLRAQVSGNDKEGSRERRMCRGPHL